MNKEQQSVIEKIRKLLALGKSANEHEATLAMERAHDMMARYNVELSQVSEKPEDEFVRDDETRTMSRPWRRIFATQLANLYFCDYIFTFEYHRKAGKDLRYPYQRYDLHSFFGAAHNVVVVKMMFEYLTDTIERLAKEGSKQMPQKQRSSYVTSFRTAAAKRLAVRLEDRLEKLMRGTPAKAKDGTNLPALRPLYLETEAKLKEAFAADFADSYTVTHRAQINSVKGAEDGFEAGNSISLDDQIGEDRAGHLLPSR